MPHKPNMIPLAERFWLKVDKTSDCWLWTASIRGANNYGAFWMDGRHQAAHRVAWELAYGPVPPGMLVCHHCDVPTCVRPDHLFLGTSADNTADMIRKGRKNTTPNRETRPRGSSHHSAKLTERDVRELRREWICGAKLGYLSTKYALTDSTVSAIVRGKTWTHVPMEPGERQPVSRNISRGESHTQSKLTESDVREMRRLYTDGTPAKNLAQRYGISLRTTFHILSRNAWKHVD